MPAPTLGPHPKSGSFGFANAGPQWSNPDLGEDAPHGMHLHAQLLLPLPPFEALAREMTSSGSATSRWRMTACEIQRPPLRGACQLAGSESPWVSSGGHELRRQGLTAPNPVRPLACGGARNRPRGSCVCCHFFTSDCWASAQQPLVSQHLHQQPTGWTARGKHTTKTSSFPAFPPLDPGQRGLRPSVHGALARARGRDGRAQQRGWAAGGAAAD